MDDVISIGNNYNNRKKTDQLNELDQNTSMAQQQANTPAVQSLSQKENFGNYGDSFANGFIKRVASMNQNVPQPITEAQSNSQNTYFGAPNVANQPTPQEQNWNARQDRMLSNPIMNSILATKAQPIEFKPIQGFSDSTNNALAHIVNMTNASRQDSYNMAQLNALSGLYRDNANVYGAEMGYDARNAQNSHTLFKENQDQLKLRNSLADNILAGINGYQDLEPKEQAQIKSKYVTEGVVPTSIEKGGWFGSPKINYATKQQSQQQSVSVVQPTIDNATKWGEQFDSLRKTGLNPKVRNINGKEYIEIDGMFFGQD